MARRGAVAAGHPDEVAAALDVLEAGGNAVDACVAGAFAAFVVEPNNAGLTGYGHLTAWSPERGSFLSVDHGPRAPAAALPGLFELAGPRGRPLRLAGRRRPPQRDRRSGVRRARCRRRAGRGARARGPAPPGARRRAGGGAGGGRRPGRLVPLARHRRTARRHPHPADGRRAPAGRTATRPFRPTMPAAGGDSTPRDSRRRCGASAAKARRRSRRAPSPTPWCGRPRRLAAS